MTHEERRAIWQERINQWQQSGLRPAAFARQHALDVKRLAYWRARLKSNAPGPARRHNRCFNMSRLQCEPQGVGTESGSHRSAHHLDATRY
ncbi:IS66 family insertion sequence element accessory protein TnpA [Undibacterium sp. Ji50W]|uniref:IS66 family insertion sequence element accessory protein TnpA n=1 Tax=Undibacterium sp. Ji50W TaxID=3413041 RepID=UPI003BF0D399